MIDFNTLLRSENLDPTTVKLVRHQDSRGRRTPYELWRSDAEAFQLYQRIQRNQRFQGAGNIASFVATPLDETLFIGMYEVRGIGHTPPDLIDPITDESHDGAYLYDLTQSPALLDYRGRLVIDWGPGARSWVQLAQNHSKAIMEIRRHISDPPFPGFLDFSAKLSTLAAVPAPWRNALASVRGIYLLIHPDSGKQYVGSASGSDGFWGRWEQYLASGHGGNKRMQDIPSADYEVSVLEVASSSADIPSILKMEVRWKDKILSRKFGLNDN